MKISKDYVPGLLFILSSFLTAIIIDIIDSKSFMYTLLGFYSATSALCGIVYMFTAAFLAIAKDKQNESN